MEMKWEKLKRNYSYVKHKKQETDGYVRDKRPKTEKLKRKEKR